MVLLGLMALPTLAAAVVADPKTSYLGISQHLRLLEAQVVAVITGTVILFMTTVSVSQ
jgi:hypothetical protein